MRLISLEVENWGPYNGVQRLDLETSPSAPIVLIEGENERGKTSLFLALRYALYGKMTDHDNRDLNVFELANWDARDAGRDFSFGVVLQFEHDGEELELSRKCKGTKEERLDGASVRILETRTQLRVIGGDPFPERDIDNRIHRILHPDISSFFLFDGETLTRVERLLKSDEAGSVYVRDSIERALGVPALRLLRGDVQDLAEEAGAEVRKAATAAKVSREATQKLEEAEDELNRATKDLEDLEILRKEAEASLQGANRELSAVEAIKEAYYDRKSLKEQVSGLQVDLDNTNEVIRQLLDQNWWLPLANALAIEADRAIEAISGHLARSEQRLLLQNELSRTESQIVDPTCQTCGQRMTDMALDELRARLRSLQTEIEDLEISVDADILRAREHRLRKFVGALGVRNQLSEFEKDAKRIRLRILDARGRIDRLNEVIQDNNLDIAALDAQANEASENLVKIGMYARQAEVRKQDALRKRQSATEEIAKLSGVGAKQANAEIRVLKLLSGYLDEAIGDFTNEMRVKIQEESSEIFRQISTESEYAGLRIDGNYYLSIVDANDRIVTRRSAGANQVVTMALIGALAKCSVEEGPIVMDTPFARLDTGHRRRILEWTAALGTQVVLFVQSGEFDRTRDLRFLDGRVGRSYVLRRTGTNATRIEGVEYG